VRNWVETGVAAGAAALALVGLAGCGSGGTSGTEGGSAVFLETAAPDYLDPQLSYSTDGWQAMWNTYIPLLTYRHAPGNPGTEVIPGLARSLPKVTRGGKTYTLFLRPGLKYSNGARIRASDFEFAVERMFEVDSGGSPFYTGIVGANAFQRGAANDISGITTDDKTGKVVINLEASSGTFNEELALMFVAPVPQGTPERDQTPSPPPGDGPYIISSSNPGRQFTLTRNPQWTKTNGKLLPQLPGGHLSKITETVVANQGSQVSQVEQNKADFMIDAPPTDRLGEVQSRYGDRFRPEPTGSTFYFWMNTRLPPFDSLRVRRAINYAIDPAAIEKLYGGLLRPTQQILPPNMPGYSRFHLYPHDMQRAKRLITEAHLPASARDITVWGANFNPTPSVLLYYQSVLKKLGFNPKLKILNGQTYFPTIGNANTPDLDTGWAGWFQDYPHPNDFFNILLNGESILRNNNNNYANLDDPAINRQIDALAKGPLTPGAETQYARLDQRIMKQAPWAPYGNNELATFTSDRIDFDKVYFHPLFDQDYTSFQLK
jgi:peptide/nickel transport system substrate-binding protein